MGSFYVSDDFPVHAGEASTLKRLAAPYPENPTSQQEDEFRHNVCVELGWRNAARRCFGLNGAPEREEPDDE